MNFHAKKLARYAKPLFHQKIRIPVIFLLLAIGLSGCIPAALVIGATAGGAVIYDKRTMKTMLQDRDSAQYAANKINASPDLQSDTHIDVAVFNHILLLVGQTKTEEQRTIAEQVVANIPHISRVFNEITIQKPTSVWRRSQDTWITTKVRSAMLTKSGLGSTQIKVVTENSVVYLMGVVTREQSDLAADVARRIQGVKKVVKVFEYPQ